MFGGAFIVAAVAGSAFLWMNREKPPTDEPAPQAQSGQPAKSSSSTPSSMDPHVAGQIRDAYQKNLADNAPPGMIDLMQGGKGSSTRTDGLPPLPDPFVVPAGHQTSSGSGSLPDLPPLPGETGSKSKPTTTEKPAKETAPKDLPPLPPLSLPSKAEESKTSLPSIPAPNR